MSDPTAAARELVLAVIDDLYDAWTARDWDRFDSHLEPDVTAWESHRPDLLRGLGELAQMRADRGEPARMTSMRTHLEEVDVWGEVAVVRYLLRGVPADPETPHRDARVTEVLRWNGSAWRIARRHAESRVRG